MKAFVYLAYQLIRRAINDGALWAYVEERVHAAELTATRGAERRAWVDRCLEDWSAMLEGVRTGLATTATWLLNLAIEAMVARLRTANPVD